MSRKKPVEINLKKRINVSPESVYESEVVKQGHGAVVHSYKRFIGKKAVVIIIDNPKAEQDYDITKDDIKKG